MNRRIKGRIATESNGRHHIRAQIRQNFSESHRWCDTTMISTNVTINYFFFENTKTHRLIQTKRKRAEAECEPKGTTLSIIYIGHRAECGRRRGRRAQRGRPRDPRAPARWTVREEFSSFEHREPADCGTVPAPRSLSRLSAKRQTVYPLNIAFCGVNGRSFSHFARQGAPRGIN